MYVYVDTKVDTKMKKVSGVLMFDFIRMESLYIEHVDFFKSKSVYKKVHLIGGDIGIETIY